MLAWNSAAGLQWPMPCAACPARVGARAACDWVGARGSQLSVRVGCLDARLSNPMRTIVPEVAFLAYSARCDCHRGKRLVHPVRSAGGFGNALRCGIYAGGCACRPSVVGGYSPRASWAVELRGVDFSCNTPPQRWLPPLSAVRDHEGDGVVEQLVRSAPWLGGIERQRLEGGRRAAKQCTALG